MGPDEWTLIGGLIVTGGFGFFRINTTVSLCVLFLIAFGVWVTMGMDKEFQTATILFLGGASALVLAGVFALARHLSARRASGGPSA